MEGGQCRLYLELPRPDAWPAVGAFAHLLDQSDISCVLFPNGEDARVKPLIDAAQRRDIAALLRGDAKLAAKLEADGVHLPADLETYEYARDLLGLGAIIGTDSGKLRDIAMTLAEAGAEYIAFADDDRDALLDKVAWWSEIFTVPCVVLGVANAEDAFAFASAGADFVAPSPALWAGGEMADTLRKFAASLASVPADDEGAD